MKKLQSAPFKIGQKLECIKPDRHWQNGKNQDTFKVGLLIVVTGKQMASAAAGKITLEDGDTFIDEGDNGYNTAKVLPEMYDAGYVIDVENMHWFKKV